MKMKLMLWMIGITLAVSPNAYGLPVIRIQPVDQTGTLGGNTAFHVLASGVDPLSYQWYKQENELTGETTSRLELTNLQLEMLGQYSVRVTDESGSVLSREAGLSMYVDVDPPFVPGLRIVLDQSQVSISWDGEGDLERAETPAGPWESLVTSGSSFTIELQPVERFFFRVRNPHPRSVRVLVPAAYGLQPSLPLIILLHGYTSYGARQESYMRFLPLAESRGFIYCFPDGIQEPDGDRFWNATDACCDFIGSHVDDVGFLQSLISEVVRSLNADPKRVFLVGHSNGGFMAYRMACERADLIAGIASLAGATFLQTNDCQPSQPVSILQIHGTADSTVDYEGGIYRTGAPHPGALESIDRWAAYNGCADRSSDPFPSIDLVQIVLPGLDTVVTRYENCPPGGAVELWTIEGGGHIPWLISGTLDSTRFAERVVEWFLAHPKP